MALSDLIKEIKIRSTNGIDENTAIVLDNERQRERKHEKHEYYHE
jgi:hypothetical protein